MLYVYRKKAEDEEVKDPPDIFQIISVKQDALVLQIIESAKSSS